MSSISPPSHDGEPGDVVTAAFDGQGTRCSRAKFTARDDVGDAETTRDERRLPVDHRVPDGARFVVGEIAGEYSVSPHTRFEVVDDLLFELNLSAFGGSQRHG